MEASGFITAKQVKPQPQTTREEQEAAAEDFLCCGCNVNTDLETRGNASPETRGSNWANAGGGASDAIHS